MTMSIIMRLPDSIPALDCPVFFAGGIPGIFGNAVGGIRGTLIGGVFHGITFSDSDVAVFHCIIQQIKKNKGLFFHNN
ncbi:PTS transporter subunit IIC [Aliivibrio fischeri]|uniref:PTS transporter subunit IIC n=1 Tax=Aliivibrio fischeri TaxID=668 RepID=UPI0022A93083